MGEQTIIGALILGIVEGLTEFLPVSSTGHLLLIGHFIGFQSTGRVFEIVIQLGAVLAIVMLYFRRLLDLALTLPSSPRSRHFVIGILLAFLPAAVIGVLAHDFIKTVLFESPLTICIALIIGGFVLLVVDRLARAPRYDEVTDYPLWLCLSIGFFQCLAMIPGTSRSGSTIVGALLLGADKRSAAEFSFFLAMPTMFGAVVYDLFQNRDVLTLEDSGIIAIGFVAAFLVAVIVVRSLLAYVSRYGYGLFGWWRIVVGSAGLVGLWLVG